MDTKYQKGQQSLPESTQLARNNNLFLNLKVMEE